MCYVCQRNFHSARLLHRVPAWAEGARNISMVPRLWHRVRAWAEGARTVSTVPDFGIGCLRGLKVLQLFL